MTGARASFNARCGICLTFMYIPLVLPRTQAVMPQRPSVRGTGPQQLQTFPTVCYWKLESLFSASTYRTWGKVDSLGSSLLSYRVEGINLIILIFGT